MTELSGSTGSRAGHFPLDALVEKIGLGNMAVDLTGVEAHSLGYLVSQLQARISRPVLVVTALESDAQRLAVDLQTLAKSGIQVDYLAGIEANPYGHLSPDRVPVMRLLGSLSRLTWDEQPPLMVCGATTLARQLVAPSVLVDNCELVSVGQELDRSSCLRRLADTGYRSVPSVEDPGTFAVRGGIIDVYPPHREAPIRIELWVTRSSPLKYFDAMTQRTTESAGDQLVLPPVREELFLPEMIASARRAILDAAGDADVPTREIQPLLEDLQNRIPFMGIEAFRPGFYPSMASLFDYLADDTLVVTYDPMAANEALRQLWEEMTRSRESAIADNRPSLPPEMHFLSPNEVAKSLSSVAQARCHVVQMVDELGAVDGPRSALRFDIPSNHDLSNSLIQSRGDQIPLRPLAVWIRKQLEKSVRVVLSCRQQTQLDRVERLLKNFGVDVKSHAGAVGDVIRPTASAM